MGNDNTANHPAPFVLCPCGAKAPISTSKSGYYIHCLKCGRLTFFRSQVLLERVRLGAKSVCDHSVEMKPCKGGGLTSWCSLCRVRTFQRPTTG